MIISPQQFAELLKRSTLNKLEQQGILALLSCLNPDEIQKLASILMADVNAKTHILEETDRRRDQLLLRFNVEVDKVDLDS